MKNSKHSTSSIEYWLDWIELFKAWVHASPDGVYSNPSYTVSDVPYEGLVAIGAHFGETVYEENKNHRKSVHVNVWHGMSMTQIEFAGTVREFVYAPQI